MPAPVDLDGTVAVDLVGGQVPVSDTVRVNAHQVPGIHHTAVGLRRMTDKDTLAAKVGRREQEIEMRPIHHRVILVRHREMGFVRGVNENIVLCFVKRTKRFQEFLMRGWYFANIAAVARNGCFSAASQPDRRVEISKNDSGEHDFVIAAKQDDTMSVAKFDQLVDHAATVRASIDVVAQKN